MYYYRKSAEQKYIPAQNALGDMYYNGRGVVHDYEEALRCYQQSAERGYSEAQYMTGIMYQKGCGLSRAIQTLSNGTQKQQSKGTQ